jgi:AcrR family transcriptional regulator
LGVSERKTRQRAEREQRIVAAAATIAEQEGWEAVTIRRLAEAIEYSQPVLYSHFASRDAIVAAVALEGFREIAAVLWTAGNTGATTSDSLANVANAYLDFASARPALYQAMFVLPTGLRFAEADTRPELRDGFDALAAVTTPFCPDVDLATEVFWGALHGMAELERAGRIKPAARQQRIRLISELLTSFKDFNPSHAAPRSR